MTIQNCKTLFPMAEDTIYLDHGGFGLTPKEILDDQIRELQKIEQSPTAFVAFDYRPAWKSISALVAKRFSTHSENLALIDNTTDGINAVLRSLSFAPGDEILMTSLAYGAIVNAAKYIAGRQGAHVIQTSIQFPQSDPGQCIEAVKAAITPRTKLAIFDHIASGAALILPVTGMTKICRDHGIPVLIDGAHVPGNIEFDLEQIKADWYVANLHKWYYVPRGCGFLWAAPRRQKGLVPNVLSWDIEQPFPQSFTWTGTRNASAWLCIPSAFNFMDRFGEAKIRQHNHALLRQGLDLLTDALGAESYAPDSMIGSIGLIRLPNGLPFAPTEEDRAKLQKVLWSEHKIMACPSLLLNGHIWLRVSAQIYNDIQDYKKLAGVINAMRR